MAESITWDLIARDRASQTVGHVGDSVERLTTRIGHLAAAFGGAFAFQQAGAFALRMADQFELSRSRLETITKNVGGSFAAIQSQVQALDNQTAKWGFSNAETEGSVASLETATKNAAKAMQDTALAADIARGRNISLEEATRILMRVETGHVAMLSKLGIATKDANGHLLTQQQALVALAAVYGGSASHYAGTFAGKQAALRAELANSAAEIGAALLPAAVDLVRVIQRDILPAVQSATQWFDRNRKTLEPLVGTVIKLGLAWKAYSIFSKAAATIGVANTAGRLAEGAVGSGAPGAASLTRPLPVYVVNMAGTYPGSGSPVTPSEAATTESRLSRFGRGALQIASVVPFAVELGKHFADVALKNGIGIPGLFNVGARKPLDPEGNLSPAFRKQVDALGGIDKALAYYQKLNLAASGSNNTLSGAVQNSTASLKAQAKALADTQSKAMDLSSGQDALRQAIHNMAVTASGQSSRALRGNSDAALANRDALRQAVGAAESYLQVLKQHGASSQRITQVEYILAKAIESNATKTYADKGAVDALLRSLGFVPSEIQAIIDKYNALHQVWFDPMSGTGANSPFRDPGHVGYVPPAVKTAASNAGKISAKSFMDGYSGALNKGVAAATNKAFDTAKQKMAADVSNIKQFYASQKQSLISTFGSLNLTPTTDSFGDSGPASSFKAQLRRDAQQMDTFARLYKRLDALHLDPRLLLQISGLGPDGIPAMRQLLASGAKGIRQVNRLETRIAGDASQIAAVQTADKFSGLIHGDLEKLPHRLAVEMRKELPKAVIKISLEDVGRRRAKRIRSS